MRFLRSFIVLSTLLVIQSSADECKKENKCECVGSDGYGFNLTSIDTLLVGITDVNVKFFFHPCGNTQILPDLPFHGKETKHECATNGYTLCMFNMTTNITKVLGTDEDMTFKREADSAEIIYTRGSTTSSVTLECTPKTKTSVLYAPTGLKDQVILSLYSKAACLEQITKDPEPRGLFYTFLLVMLTLLFSYLFIGMLINYFFIGARGFELIPNYDFWCKVWRSAKLFFIFAKNGCRAMPNEDSYDAI